MSYLRDFGAKLQEKLGDLDEKTQKEVVKFCKEAVLESYRNGQKSPVSEKKQKSS